MNSSKIDKIYSQTGEVCVFASYSIIMNYFSNGRIKILNLFDRYVQNFHTQPENNTIFEIEESIKRHYHQYCQEHGLRGFPFIADCHKRNVFLTRRFCVPVLVRVNSGIAPLSRQHNKALRNRLRKGGLAMVLIKIDAFKYHAVVVGYDKRKNGYFYRNPKRYNNEVLVREDILKTNDIYEYILFERRKRYNHKKSKRTARIR